MRGRLRRALAGVAVAVAVLAGVEVVARLALGPPPSTGLVRELWRADQPIFVEREGWVRAAFQSPNWTPPFTVEPTRPRVMVFGESSVHDGALRLQDEIPGRLERELRARGLEAEVVNLGRSGADSHVIHRFAREAARYRPDVAVFYMGHNDIGNAFMLERYGEEGSYRAARLRVALERSRLYAAARQLVIPPVSAPEDFFRLRPPYDEPPLTGARLALAEGALRQNLVSAAHALRAAGAGIVLATVTSNLRNWDFQMPVCPDALPPDTWKLASGRALLSPISLDAAERAIETAPDCPEAHYLRGMALVTAGRPAEAVADLERARDLAPIALRATSGVGEAIRAAADESGATLVDVERAFTADGPPPEAWFLDMLHPSAEGGAAIARLLVPSVEEMLRARQKAP